jgi:hypothetical protein
MSNKVLPFLLIGINTISVVFIGFFKVKYPETMDDLMDKFA